MGDGAEWNWNLARILMASSEHIKWRGMLQAEVLY